MPKPTDKTAEAGNSAPKFGDVLFSKDGTVGKVHVVREDRPFAVLSSIAILRPKPSEVDSDYLAQVLPAPDAVAAATRLKTGSAVRRIILSDLKQIRVPLPPIDEQRRIADILDCADALRANRREALALLDDLTQSIFLEMFGDPISNDHGHIVRPLIEWVDPKRPITYGILKPGEDVPGGVKYIRVVDMKAGGIDSSAVKCTSEAISAQYGRSVLQADDILISIRGHVGRCALVPPDLSGANITQDTARLAVDRDSALYVMECLRTDSMQYWMRQRTKGAAVQGINLGDIKVLPVPEPKKELQLEFAERAGRARAVLTSARLQLLRFDEMFASLQQRAFAGLLSHDPNRLSGGEPA